MDTVTNISAQPCELELLYHINFGPPLLTPGAKAVVPVAKLAPRDAVAVENLPDWAKYGPETPGSKESVFFLQLAADKSGNTRVLLENSARDKGVSLRFNVSQLPYFIIWKNRQAVEDGYVTGFEPAINFPNRRSFEKKKGRVAELAPGEKRDFAIDLEFHADAPSVTAAEAQVARLQEAVEPVVYERPDPEWSAG